jgi:hypothetical protein
VISKQQTGLRVGHLVQDYTLHQSKTGLNNFSIRIFNDTAFLRDLGFTIAARSYSAISNDSPTLHIQTNVTSALGIFNY